MNISFNGEPKHVPDRYTLSQLLDSEDLTESRIAVEINGEIVPRSEHGSYRLHTGDRIEVVHAVGGG
ncbi:MAG: sulfur carrier protein ThiS [Pseudomonadota bacterium]|nr:sulfur carrier protein ThiS [Pseudomonadota bacterium]